MPWLKAVITSQSALKPPSQPVEDEGLSGVMLEMIDNPQHRELDLFSFSTNEIV